jgi:hypothetical protein
MYTIFIEYRIQKEKWEKFIQAIPQQLQAATKELGTIQRHAFLTGREQPYLVVEVIEAENEQLIAQIYHRRQTITDSMYQLLWPWIDKDRTNLQIWVFEPLHERER